MLPVEGAVGFVRVSSFVQGLAGEDGAGEHAVFPPLPKPGKGQGQAIEPSFIRRSIKHCPGNKTRRRRVLPHSSSF